jgi:putative hydrolase of the HAD superfamily
MFDMIAFDADDTLWHEQLYVDVQTQLQSLAGYVDPEAILDQLYTVEMRNLNYFGYGVKASLSMIETAIELTGGRGWRDIQN